MDRDVERGDRFVGDEQVGFEGESAGDCDTLTLAAGKHVGALIVCGCWELDEVEQFSAALFDSGSRSQTVHEEHLADRGADSHLGVE